MCLRVKENSKVREREGLGPKSSLVIDPSPAG